MKTCPDCGCRVYGLGCVNCDEGNYIEQQGYLDSLPDEYAPPEPGHGSFEHPAKLSACCGWPVRDGLCGRCWEHA